MRVEYRFRDNVDTYDVEAEVNGSRVQVLTVTDSYGTLVDWDDFSDSEKGTMKGLAFKARDVLESLEDEEREDNDDEYAEAY